MHEKIATHQHYKGGFYKVLFEDVHDANNGHEFNRLSIIYESLDAGYISMRYADEFYELIEVNGQKVPRFKRLIVEHSESDH